MNRIRSPTTRSLSRSVLSTSSSVTSRCMRSIMGPGSDLRNLIICPDGPGEGVDTGQGCDESFRRSRVERTVGTMRCRAVTLIILLGTAVPAAAQVTGSISGPVTTPRPRAPQSPAPQAPSGGEQGSNPFLGSVPQGPPSPEPLSLSAKDAVERALRNNLGLLLQEQSASSAGGARWRALAELLPDLTSGLSERRQVINLEAFGFPAEPSIVGPFNVFDARVFLSQPVFSISGINDAKAASLNVKAEKYGIKSARDLVVLVTLNLYLEAISADSRVASVRAQRETAEALFKQAQDMKSSGVVAGIDVLRAQVELQTQRQRLIAAQNDFEKLKLQLARAIGLPVGQAFVLTDKIPYEPLRAMTLDTALARAYE